MEYFKGSEVKISITSDSSKSMESDQEDRLLTSFSIAVAFKPIFVSVVRLDLMIFNQPEVIGNVTKVTGNVTDKSTR